LATTVGRIFDRICAAAPDAIALLYRGGNTGKLLIHVEPASFAFAAATQARAIQKYPARVGQLRSKAIAWRASMESAWKPFSISSPR
jgi:hypothetical protein